MINQLLFILGREQAISAEELYAVFGLDKVEVLNSSCCLVQSQDQPEELIKRLGGTVKIVAYSGSVPRIEELTADQWLKLLKPLGLKASGKFTFGVSSYGWKQISNRWFKLGLEVKKLLGQSGISARFVTSKEDTLSSVIVAKNKLLGSELIVIKADDQKIHYGLTQAVQPFEAYGQRDYGKPARDSERGMLAPKLAQVLINLAAVSRQKVILDPFCGTGTVLQEALLLGYRQVIGSDSDSLAITAAKKNLEWLAKENKLGQYKLIQADVRNIFEQIKPGEVQAVVTEPYLGPARELAGRVQDGRRKEIVAQLTNLYLQAFEQFNKILPSGGRVVMIWPVFIQEERKIYLPLMEKIEASGFVRTIPAVVNSSLAQYLTPRKTLIYQRPGQVVTREITVWHKQ